ncbi:MAL6 [Candida jiufengensis]|uniref:MAL6 n=1 Tax=Candida jiufengensis TaxID=497108 RepID=UPI00222478A5|nr:MAL6 [Candida jiufengensis]KAI5955631.1 MAL6 [Candida jiufengensis]
MTKDYTWWKDATVYQIYPSTFIKGKKGKFEGPKDVFDGETGDLKGIISKLDYLADITDVIWLSPHYLSPNNDMGYDIESYEKILPRYGSVEDMQTLIDECHKRGMKIICDLVINHTSDLHDWFKESRSSLDNPKRDWYIWKKPKYDDKGNRKPPNNWGSYFSGSAWEYDSKTDEYYLRLFDKSQPDLNWENEETRKAIYDSAMKFWLDRGVDGFRIDTAGLYSKVQDFPDAPVLFPEDDYQPSGNLTLNGPRIHFFHKEMYDQVTSNYDAMTVGEVGHCSREEALKYVSASRGEMNMIFLFDTVDVGSDKNDRFRYNGFDLKDLKEAIKTQCEFTEGTDAWSTVFIENHDQPRCITRFGDKKYQTKSGKLLAMFQTTLTGTLFIYQGQEIGMTNVPRDWPIEEYQDVNTINYYNQFKDKYGKDADFAEKEQKLMDIINLLARDNARTPMQWDDSENAGFSDHRPWSKVNPNYKEINVAKQLNDPNSLLNFYKKSLKLRKKYKDLSIYGSFEILDFDNKQTFTYVKSLKDAKSPKAYVVLNFSKDNAKFERLIDGQYELISTNVDKDEFDEEKLSPFEGRIYIVN